MADLRLFHGCCIAAEQLLLDLSQRRTSLDQINRLDARRKSLEIAKRLSKPLSALRIHHPDLEKKKTTTHSHQIVHQRPLPRSHLH